MKVINDLVRLIILLEKKLAFDFENFRKQKKHKNYKSQNIEFDYSMTILINLIKRILKFK